MCDKCPSLLSCGLHACNKRNVQRRSIAEILGEMGEQHRPEEKDLSRVKPVRQSASSATRLQVA